MGESIDDPLAALEQARAHYTNATDFTIGIEEEFQIIDRDSLALTQRFLDLKALADQSDLAGNVAGELISSEIEIKTGRCETFAQAAATLHQRRATLIRLADQLGVGVAAIGTHPFSPWQEQVIIDTPHYRAVEHNLKYVAWRNNTFGIHVHVGIRNADRAIAVANALRCVLPELIAVSANSPWLDERITHLRSTRTQIFTRMFPRCGVPDAFASWSDYEAFVRFLLETGSIREHTEIWWSVRPHQSFGTVEVRVCDALADIDESIAVCALQVALVARFAAMFDAGVALPSLEHRFIEENLWRAIRWGLDWELIDYGLGRSIAAADRLRRLVEDCHAEIDTLGLAGYLAPLWRMLDRGDAGSRLIRRAHDGAALRDLYAEQVALTRAVVDAKPKR
jgi:glutamate---cysteine ligase / carboxylate-amine ligase